MSNLRIIAVDFDGTLCTNAYPEIGAPMHKLIDFLKKVRAKHDNLRLILWTCRTGAHLEEAVKWCTEQGLIFDAINENLPENIAEYGGVDSRKIFADIYIDDRAWPQSFLDLSL